MHKALKWDAEPRPVHVLIALVIGFLIGVLYAVVVLGWIGGQHDVGLDVVTGVVAALFAGVAALWQVAGAPSRRRR